MKKLVLLWFALIFGCLSVYGQFQLNGNTADFGGGNFRLTQAINSQFGAIWYKVQHDINLPFNVQGQMNFGADPGGADGIAFVMQQNCLTAGGGGGGLGYSGIAGPSIAVEFDTYQNIFGSGVEENNDPAFDHISVQLNGDVIHDGNANDLTAPIQMDALLPSIKTGTWYDYQINYNPTTHVLQVYFNGTLRVNIVYDIKTAVFTSNQYVYWGFTSTTGGFNNVQQITVDANFSTKVLGDTTFCSGSVPVTLPNLNSLRGTNLALNNPVFVSSGDGSKTQINDGNQGSRWESDFGIDPQWVYIDLQSPVDIDSVVLDWEGAFATAFEIQTSNDASTWTTHYSTSTNTGGHNRIIFSASNQRYVRMYGTARSLSAYGYSIWEFKVYGQPKYLWSPNNGTVSSIYGESVVLSPVVTTTYTVTIPDPCVGFTTLTSVITIDCPLPITLLDFAVQSSGNGAIIQWSSSSETNTSHFMVMKSNDGIQFYPIGTVSATHFNATAKEYSFYDQEHYIGTVYYQLAAYDFDGTIMESKIIHFSHDAKLFVVPQPVFSENLIVLIQSGIEEVAYAIIDLVGREVQKGKSIPGNGLIFLETTLSPACYVLILSTSSASQSFKICKTS